MSDDRKGLGARGESLAATYLQQQGYVILARNWRASRLGEIDIVAREEDCLVLVEVKTRRSRDYGLPEESVTPAKQARLLSLAQAYLAEEVGDQDVNWRIDVVAVEISPRGKVQRMELFRNAVQGQF